MMAVLIVLAIIAFAALYHIHKTDRTAREKVTLYHLQSSGLAQQLLRSNQSALDLLNDPLQSDVIQALSDSSMTSPGPDVQVMLATMVQQCSQLRLLQDQFRDAEFAETLQNVSERLERAVKAWHDEPVSGSTPELLASLGRAADQLYRQHDSASARMLEDIGAISRQALPSFGVIGLLLLLIGLTTWVTARQLRRALSRQVVMEQALSESQERVYHMQKLDALGQLVGGIAHDFNNLLTAILGHAGLLLDKPGQDESQRFGLSQIKQAGEQAATLTRQLLAFSRPEVMESRVFDISELVRDTEDLLRRLIGENVELTVRNPDNQCLVEMDPGQLQQIILNLAINARDAMPGGGQLTLSTRYATASELERLELDSADGGYVRLAVIDSGEGMDKETQERIFDPYFTTKAKDRGTGLGLSTVHGIVTATGGRIRVFSKPGAGSRFEIYLPGTNKSQTASATRSASKQQFYGTETVLIVEDEEKIRRFLNDGLGSLGYRVFTAANADDGLKICLREKDAINVIVSDVVLPQINGVAFLKKARRLCPEALGIFISGYTDDVLINTGVESSKTPLIYKPFELNTLADLIRRQLDSAAA